MASGFVVLRDGRCLSVRHAVHDAMLRSVIVAMDADAPLRAWLATQAPGDDDVELGYAFVRASDGEHVLRELDLRALTAPNQTVFETAAREAVPTGGPSAPAEDVPQALARLRQMLHLCDQGRPPLELSDWRTVAPPCERKVGPGWTGS
jgi:hypothetical protein